MNWLAFLALAGILTTADALILSLVPYLSPMLSDQFVIGLAGLAGTITAAAFRSEIAKRDGWWMGRAIAIGWLAVAMHGFAVGSYVAIMAWDEGGALAAPILLPFVFAVMAVPVFPIIAPLSIATVAALRPLATKLQVQRA